MNKSFSDKLKAGWSRERLMKYYCLSEERYNKTIQCLEDIRGALMIRKDDRFVNVSDPDVSAKAAGHSK